MQLEIDKNNNSQTIKTHEHISCSYGLKVVCKLDDELSSPYKEYKGVDCVENFFETLFDEADRITKCKNRYRNVKDMKITNKQQKEYNNCKYCYLCKNSFTEKNCKVRDHCHVTGLFRGAACNDCNIKLRITNVIPVLFHNLRHYDSHLLMQELGKFKDKQIKVIPNNMEKYMSFSVCTNYTDKDTNKTRMLHELKFIDSFQFMSTSLSKLVDNLNTGEITKFKYLLQEFGADSKLMTRKGVYPYSYMNDWKKFDIHVSKLCMEDFRNDLTGDDITIEDFSFFKSICKQFNIKTLGAYHDLYLKSDVLLLADVFENFRIMCKDYYGLDCAHYISAPGFAWDCLLKKSNIELDLIADVDQHLFIEEGLRGGISVITHRKSEANNKYMTSYNENKESTYITYLDCVNLYGCAMCEYLPYGGIKWLENPEKLDVRNVAKDLEVCHFLEVDIEYPEDLHDLHNDYPYCPEQVIVKDDILSDYCKMIFDKHQLM